MCQSEKGNSKVFKEFCMQNMLREYWRGSIEGRNVMS